MKPDISVIIPARNEIFLAKTIENLIENIQGNTEIIAVCDGYWPVPPIQDNPKVHIIYHTTALGQRASTNKAVQLSRAKYIIKVDAHCSFDKGFDVKMLEVMQDDWTMVPIMRNLHAFDWVCEEGHRRYQGPSGPCDVCGKPTTMDIKWIGKNNPQSTSYCFDSEPHFQYFNKFKERPEYIEGKKKGLTETMSLQGSFFMLTREKYLELNICDEAFGNWGSQGIEVACKTWLSGGRVVVNHNTWYAHMFRTQGGDFSFPWPASGRGADRAKKYAKDLFFTNSWDKQVRPLSWLLEKFWPVPGWTEKQLEEIKDVELVDKDHRIKHYWIDRGLNVPDGVLVATPSEGEDGLSQEVEEEIKTVNEYYKVRNTMEPKIGIVYYTDNRGDEVILEACRNRIRQYFKEDQIVSVSLKPLDFGKNIVLNLERGVLTMFKQILAGVEASDADIIFLAEHDVLYHPSHWDFRPSRKDLFYYDENRWFVDAADGKALFYRAMSTSLLCAHKDLLVEHYRKRVKRVEEEGFSLKLGYEPGNHPYPRGVDHYRRESWMAPFPSIDIRHSKNLTPSRWSQDQFRNKGNLRDWQFSDEIPGWGLVKGRFFEFLKEALEANMPYKRYDPVPESEMFKERYRGHYTICQFLRDIYQMTDNEEIKMKCRIGIRMTKKMHERLKYYKSREQERLLQEAQMDKELDDSFEG